MDELNATVRTLIQVLDTLRPKKEPREQPFAPGGDLFKPIQAMLSGMASAAMAAANALMGVVQASLRYVAVLTPSAAFAFQQALRDLHATIGVALLPVVQTATGFLREFAARLLPITSQLQPLVAQLGAVFTQLAGIFLERFSRLAEGLMPVLKTLTELVGIVAELTRPLDMLGNIVLEVGVAAFKVMAAVLQPIIEALKSVSPLFLMLGDALQVLQLVLQAVTETVVRTLGSLLGGFDFRSWTEGLRKGFQELLKATVLLIGSLAKLVGATTFLENLIKAFDPDPNKQSAQGLATVQNAQFQAFGDIGRSVAMQSIMAGPGGASASPEEQWRKSIADSLKAIEDGTALDQMLSDLQEAVLAKFDALIDAVKGAVWDAPRSAFHAATFGIFEKQVTLTKAR